MRKGQYAGSTEEEILQQQIVLFCETRPQIFALKASFFTKLRIVQVLLCDVFFPALSGCAEEKTKGGVD